MDRLPKEKITISLPRELLARIEKASIDKHLSKSVFIQIALEEYLDSKQS